MNPTPENGYAGARYLRDTPYETVTEWSQAILAAIPEAERCGVCEGRGPTVAIHGAHRERPITQQITDAQAWDEGLP